MAKCPTGKYIPAANTAGVLQDDGCTSTSGMVHYKETTLIVHVRAITAWPYLQSQLQTSPGNLE